MKTSSINKKRRIKSSCIDGYDNGFTEGELAAVKRSLIEVAKIKKGEMKPLSMNDLWDE